MSREDRKKKSDVRFRDESDQVSSACSVLRVWLFIFSVCFRVFFCTIILCAAAAAIGSHQYWFWFCNAERGTQFYLDCILRMWHEGKSNENFIGMNFAISMCFHLFLIRWSWFILFERARITANNRGKMRKSGRREAGTHLVVSIAIQFLHRLWPLHRRFIILNSHSCNVGRCDFDSTFATLEFYFRHKISRLH